MHEAEIAPAGEIMLDKRPVGRVEGFRFAAGKGPALTEEEKAALAPVLAACYERQAEHFAAAANGAIALDQSGFIRWTGWLVARLTPGEDVLQPGFVLLADDEVSPAAREKMAQRVRRFISFWSETALKPLFDLAGAEALAPRPRFIALKLVEQLGLVPRRAIAAELKELDQESRAALRRFGVRFGVYHVFLPALLKPAPAQALTSLWALKNAAPEHQGAGAVVAQLMAGRTSFAIEEGVEPAFYRLAGYRVLGKRAVRIDMLERCADLIRQAMAWRPGNGAARPEGAYDGKHFTISPAMLSILGSRQEDMAEILRQLGYVARPLSRADYQAFLQDKGAAGAAPAAGAVPAAEPIGDWPVIKAEAAAEAAAPQPDAKASPKAPGGEAASVPPAEPVGAKFADSGKTADETVILWHYQKRNYKKPHKKEGRPSSRAIAGRKGERAAENRAAAGAAGKTSPEQRSKRAAAKGGAAHGPAGVKKAGAPDEGQKRGAQIKRNFDSKTRQKPRNIEDSPFAALMALRDKLRQ